MTIHVASEAPYRDYEVISTGMPNLDKATGIGGVPTRRITEIYGVKSVGKTTMALTLVAQAQKEGRKVLWLDQEFTFDFGGYAEKLGVNLKKLMFVQEQVAEDALDDALGFAAKEENALIIIDSIGALHPRAESEKNSDGKIIGGQAKLVSTFCRRIVPLLTIQNHALLVINHSFQDLMHGTTKTSGGEKLNYHKSLSISLKQSYGKQVTRATDGAKVGVVIEAEIMKNKMAATAGTKVDLMMIPGSGFSIEHDMLQDMLASGAVIKKGNSFFRGETKMGVGMKAAREFLKANPV